MFATVDFALLGMTLIVVAWAIQFLYSWVHPRQISRAFVVLYGVGVLGLVLENLYISSTFSTVTWLHITTLLLIVLILLRIQR
jgi:hypothetical protein